MLGVHCWGGYAEYLRLPAKNCVPLGASGEVHVLIDQVMPLREAGAAHRLVATNMSVGKIVLDPTLT